MFFICKTQSFSINYYPLTFKHPRPETTAGGQRHAFQQFLAQFLKVWSADHLVQKHPWSLNIKWAQIHLVNLKHMRVWGIMLWSFLEKTLGMREISWVLPSAYCYTPKGGHHGLLSKFSTQGQRSNSALREPGRIFPPSSSSDLTAQRTPVQCCSTEWVTDTCQPHPEAEGRLIN